MAKFTLRLPDDIYEAIKRLAEKHDRSLTAQVIRLLRRAIAEGWE